jgi:hypothetical protein
MKETKKKLINENRNVYVNVNGSWNEMAKYSETLNLKWNNVI